VASCCEHGNGHSGFIKGREFFDQISFSRRTLLHGISYNYLLFIIHVLYIENAPLFLSDKCTICSHQTSVTEPIIFSHFIICDSMS
jgi:hypothetical protein